MGLTNFSLIIKLNLFAVERQTERRERQRESEQEERDVRVLYAQMCIHLSFYVCAYGTQTKMWHVSVDGSPPYSLRQVSHDLEACCVSEAG